MPRNLEPNQIWLPAKLTRGALVTLPDPKAQSQTVEVLRFQYNPETVTRTRTGQWEHRLDKKGKLTDAQKKAEMDAHRGGGLKSKSETISMKLMFDATELALRAGGFDKGDATTGVLPELAVLERLALGPDQVPEPKKDDSEFPLIALNPTEVLLVLGDRQFPAVVTSVNIVEQRFAPNLVPIRAEVELRLRVLEATKSATNKMVEKAFTELLAARQKHSAIAVYTGGDVTSALSSALSGSDRDNSNANVDILFANTTSKPIGG
ncbi:MAG: hypothetical protein K8M05_41695 [Deltaproteobacteria bacterium]|nr:hypothetical protein [Kofleriaceae bacterium]